MTRCYTVGDIEIRPDERRVLNRGEPVALGARAFDLLMCLVERRDRVVTKRELLELVWPGSVVEESNLTVHVSALRKLLGAEALATVPGRGYRFAMAVSSSGTQSQAPPNPVAATTDRTPASVATPTDTETWLPLPSLPSIAVLPFHNLGGDPAQEVFIDGVTEDVITELSRFRSLFVIARNSTFSYKGRAVDVRTIARELGVRYVVEGSIRRSAERIRVAAQLIDACTGAHLWAERYDRALEDLFAVQEELTRAIVAAVAPQIESFEFQKLRSVRRGSLTAYELAMRARDMARWADREAEAALHDHALELASEAVAIDPHCGTALATIAYLRWRQLWANTGAPLPESLDAGLAAARHAIAVDSGDHLAHLWKGMLSMFASQYDAGLADLRRAHDLNPNDALTLSLLGQYEAGAGNPHGGIQNVMDALRLSPRDALRWSFLNSLAWAHFFAGDYVAAAESAARSIAEAPRFFPPHLCLVVSHIGLGNVPLAMSGYRVLHDLAPQQAEARIAGRWTISDPALRLRATHFLRVAAGLEEAGSRQD